MFWNSLDELDLFYRLGDRRCPGGDAESGYRGLSQGRIDSAGDVSDALTRDHQPLPAASLFVIDSSGRAGLLVDPEGGLIGIAEAMGDRIVSRCHRASELSGFTWQMVGERPVLSLQFDDFTLPRLELSPPEGFDRVPLTAGLEAMLEKTEIDAHE